MVGNYNNTNITLSSVTTNSTAALFGNCTFFYNLTVILQTLTVNTTGTFSLLSYPNVSRNVSVILCNITFTMVNCS